MEKTELHKEWERRIGIFEASGQTQAKWCAANDLNIHQLKYWLKKIKGPKSTNETKSKFTPVLLAETSTNDTLEIKVGQASVEVRPGFDPRR
ncbi:IS66 family insertion sequence element accessory protein TnpA [Peribacillus cavernae]|uniref:IS66 family insertion sequence element accessory protein TnpA n=1 Tax=Peribacillus cavernae TaxID=1674310 RepID=UPI001FE59424|nr:IS66 family insertion sequence element accessory protein TnpB [Peribacillus cavernae]MDQ0218636.1 hypothetical protein [Peribacillus cavernae]